MGNERKLSIRQKIVREIKRPFRLLLTGLKKKLLHPIHKSIFCRALNSSDFREELRHLIVENVSFRNDILDFLGFDHQLRLKIPLLEMQVVYGCNLHCSGCATFSPISHGAVPLESIVKWSQNWSSKISPETVSILGGEPLLHANLDKIIYSLKDIWKEARFQLITNGLLVPKIKDELLDAIKKTNVAIVVSKHYSGDDFDREFNIAMDVLRNAGISFNVRPSFEHWVTMYELDSEGRARVSNSNPALAWQNCYGKVCATLMDNQIYKCSILASIDRTNRAGTLLSEWKERFNYTPLTIDSSPMEIRNHLYSREIAICSICPEKYTIGKQNDPRIAPKKR